MERGGLTPVIISRAMCSSFVVSSSSVSGFGRPLMNRAGHGVLVLGLLLLLLCLPDILPEDFWSDDLLSDDSSPDDFSPGDFLLLFPISVLSVSIVCCRQLPSEGSVGPLTANGKKLGQVAGFFNERCV